MMKKYKCLILLVAMASGAPLTAAEPTEVEVHPGVRYQEIEGFGTALGWWTNVVGGWDEPTRSDIIRLVFDKKEGLGLSIIKYYIGGTENPDCPADTDGETHFAYSREMEGFKLTEDGPYDWTREANQRRVLQEVMENYDIDGVEANALTGPWWMTVSGCVAGHVEPGVPNLKETYYDDYADYLVTVVKHFREQWGVTFQTISPFAEASQDFWKMGGNQEGCFHTNEQANRLVKLLGRKLEESGLPTTVSAPDEWSVGESIDVYQSFDDKAKSVISAIGAHSYWGSLRDRYAFRNLVKAEGKKAIMSETSERGGYEDDHVGMHGALEMAWHLTTDIRDMGSHIWLWFEPVVNEQVNLDYNGNWGAIHAYYQGPKAGQYAVTKTFSGVAHYTRFLGPGYVVIDNTDPYTLSAYHPGKKELVLVVYNDSGAEKRYRYSIDGPVSIADKGVERHRTTVDHQIRQLPALEIDERTLEDTLPPESISTYVFRETGYDGNLYRNINDNVTGSGLDRFGYEGTWRHWEEKTEIAKWTKVLEAENYYKGYKKRLYSRDCHWSTTPGDTSTFRFRGKEGRLYGVKGRDYGTMIVRVNGRKAAEVDCYSEVRRTNALLFVTGPLDTGEHRIEIELTGKKSPDSSGTKIALDRMQVVY